MKRIPAVSCVLFSLAPALFAGAGESADQLLERAGVAGGLVVHVGCGDGSLTAALRANDRCVVHGLDTDPAAVAAARKYITEQGVYGPVAVDRFDGKHLPYAENLVDLVVAADPGGVSPAEMMRVLSPGGVALVQSGDAWRKSVKPVPPDIDSWPHYLHGADNNAVARDTVVGPPRRMQWVGGPHFARSHEINSSMAALVSGGGRLFYIWDENPTGMTDPRFPANWKLIARDAFNGTVLWKRPVPDWGWRQWHPPSRWKDPRERAKMLRMLPATAPRRLVAAGDRVYVTLGYAAPLSAVDAATGEILRTYEGTSPTDEILHVDGTLVLRVRTPDSPPEKDVWGTIAKEARARVTAVDAETGRQRWRTEPDTIAPLTIAARAGRVYYSDYERVVCRDMTDGAVRWRSEPIAGRTGNRGTVGTLVAQDEAVFFTTYPGGKGENAGRLHALSAERGKLLWRGPRYRGPGITNPPDLFVAGGLVWLGETRLPIKHTHIELKRQGLDPLTGKVRREVTVPKLISWGHHYRCYRSKATERFLLLPKRGVEFVDLVGDEHMRHDWLRPPCIYGVLPANGLLYTGPHQCVCYQGVLLSNFNALAPAAGKKPSLPEPQIRLRKGPAWGKIAEKPRAAKGDWPAYRRDPRRSGAAQTAVPAAADAVWTAALRGPLSPPVVAGGRLLVAEKDAHAVCALDAETGKRLWRFTAGGRVDSPPAVCGSLVLFGSADGRVYCLRLADGREVWRFLAAPRDKRIAAFGQVESAWRVHGSVLVQEDPTLKEPRPVAYCTAGRSTFLDGGIYLYGLDPRTGAVLHEHRLAGPRPDPVEDRGGAGYMDGARSGILVSDGADIYLFQERFRADLKRFPAKMERFGKEGGGYRNYQPFPDRGSSGRRLITTHGFLSDVDNEGKYWTFGSRWPGWNRKMGRIPAYGQLLVFDEKTLYGVHVFTDNIRVRRGRTLGGKGQRLFARPHGAKKDRWSQFVPIRVRGLVLAGEKLVLAGTPDVVPDDDPPAAIEGRRGAVLRVVAAADGAKTAERTLDAPPVFDGLIAAGGRLYVSDTRGRVVCLGGK